MVHEKDTEARREPKVDVHTYHMFMNVGVGAIVVLLLTIASMLLKAPH